MKNAFLLLVGVVLLTSCSNVFDQPLNKEDLQAVKDKVEANEEYSSMKKKYLIRQVSDQTGFVAMAEAMEIERKDLPTFKEVLQDASSEFDSIRSSKLEYLKQNAQLENFVKLKDAKTHSIDKYKGYLGMTLEFDNQFEQEILYIILNYKYVNKYDSKFFDESSKLTDEVAGKFEGELEISTTEEYNNVADFMYSEVPIQAPLSLRQELGEEEANRKVERDFLMEGLQVKPLLIVFKDKTELSYQDAEWEYLDEEEKNIALK